MEMNEAPVRFYRCDDPNPEVAGLGLADAPFIQSFAGEDMLYWMMSPAEQMAMGYLLSQRKPPVAIEIGTRAGGSLQVIARFATRVYSLDIDPSVRERLQGRWPNVEFVTGPSDMTLPTLLSRLDAEGADLGLALVDGDHTRDGVRKDIDALLSWKPKTALYIVMHDSFNPGCRAGLRDADWAANPYVDFVELDFVPGVVSPTRHFRGQLWGGLALARMLPERRTHTLEIGARAQWTFERADRPPVKPSLFRRALNKAKRTFASSTPPG